MTDKQVLKWRDDGKYLPKLLQDFHDQKDLFKTMHESIDLHKHAYAKSVSWVAGHCYVIDVFLWFMARHGYTLQRTRTKLDFDDIGETIEACNAKRLESMRRIFNVSEAE